MKKNRTFAHEVENFSNMKKIAFLLATMLATYSMSAQVKTIVRSTFSSTKGEVANIDNVKYRITYEGRWVNNPAITPFIYTESEMRLDIGENTTCFYDRTKQIKDSLMTAKTKAGNYDFSDLPKGGRFPFTFYKNYPTAGKTLLLETVGMENFQCTEDIDNPDWQIVPDSIADIIGYHSQLATTHFKGRTWYAWYAEDIPMQEGPWKLCGLPGLILKVYDENKEYVFSAIGMSTLTTATPITISKVKREEISQKKLRETKEKFTPAMVLEGLDLKAAKVYDEKGNPVDFKKIMNKKSVFNPLELQ